MEPEPSIGGAERGALTDQFDDCPILSSLGLYIVRGWLSSGWALLV